MSADPRGLPDVDDPETGPYWAAAATEQRLVAQECEHGHLQWPPTKVCSVCQSMDLHWREVRPTGVLWSFATYHRALAPEFADDVPYTVGLIMLDDGPRVYGRLAEGAVPAIGERMRADFRPVTERTTLVVWEPDPAARH